MSVARRLIGSFGASVLGPAVTIFIQLVNVPIMLRTWGPELYGEWLILSAAPTYLLLSDLGFGNVAGSDMTMRVNAGDRAGALETFQSTQALVALTSLIIATLLAIVVIFLPVHRMLHLSALSPVETRNTLALLSLNSLIVLQWSTIMAGYRATQRYAVGMLYTNLIRIVEGASIWVVLFSHLRPTAVAAIMLGISAAGTAGLMLQHWRQCPWLSFGFVHARWIRIRRLSRPAFAYMAIPAGNALTTQGMTMMVGIVLGPAAVAIFNPMRTLSRVVLQLSNAVQNSVWPELSAAFGRQDWQLARNLHRAACQFALVCAILVSAVLALAGPRVFAVWTHGQLVLDRPAFYLLLLAALAYVAWNASSAVPLAANRHQRLALLYLVCSAASLGLSGTLTRHLGLPGAAFASLLCDGVMAVYVVRVSNRLLNDRWQDFSASLLDARHLRKLLRARSAPPVATETVES